MTAFRAGILVLALIALAACTSTRPAGTSSAMALAPEPAAITAQALKATNVSDFVDAQALAVLSEKERTEAASAQFYALQFGRPGAPRQWQGDKGSSGRISVGPYVRVNERDCREFTHEVQTSAGTYKRSGLACRLDGGTWEAISEV